MHILIIPSSVFLTKEQPLNGIFQLHQARAFKSAGHDVGVLSVGFVTIRYLLKKYAYPRVECIDGIFVYRAYKRIYVPFSFLNVNAISNTLLALAENLFRDYVSSEGKPDIIHIHNFLYAGVVGCYIRDKYGIPFVVTEHSSSFELGGVSLVELQLVQNIAKKASMISAVSSSFCLTLSNLLYRDVVVLPNIVDSKFINFSDPDRKHLEKKGFTFFNAASLDENKNHEILIEAFSACFKHKDVKLRIAGEGHLLSRLKKVAKYFGVYEQVSFLGRLSHEQIKLEMEASDCFVLSSNYETFGVVLIEALATGIPVISSRCGGPEDIVNADVGYVFEPKDVVGLSNCMLTAFSNINTFSKDYLKNYALSKYGEAAFLKNITLIFDTALKMSQ